MLLNRLKIFFNFFLLTSSLTGKVLPIVHEHMTLVMMIIAMVFHTHIHSLNENNKHIHNIIQDTYRTNDYSLFQ